MMKKKFKDFCYRLFSNFLFWLFVAFSSLCGFISIFERYTQFGVDKIYRLF